MTARVLNTIGNMFGETHCYVAPMKGSFRENESYCSKEESFTKVGDEPKMGFRGDLEETKDCIMRGDITLDRIACEDPHMYHMYGRTEVVR